MGRILTELKSAFIFNRAKRRKFRSEHREELHPDLKFARMVLDAMAVARTHEKSFSRYRNAFAGRTVVIVACGPTAAEYKPIEGAVHIGVNSAYRLPNVALDFLFTQDCADGNRERRHEFNEYRPGKCVKFYGLLGCDVVGPGNRTWSQSDANAADAERYYIREGVRGCPGLIPYDISAQPLADYQNVVFAALQFALWTNPREICLVGCDCSRMGHFDTKKPNWLDLDAVFAGYDDITAFAGKWYPDTEIKVIRPVGLKGRYEEYVQ